MPYTSRTNLILREITGLCKTQHTKLLQGINPLFYASKSLVMFTGLIVWPTIRVVRQNHVAPTFSAILGALFSRKNSKQPNKGAHT